MYKRNLGRDLRAYPPLNTSLYLLYDGTMTATNNK